MNGEPDTLLNRLTRHARDRADAQACADGNASISFGQLLHVTLRVVTELQAHGPAGARLIVVTRNNQASMFPWFLGALWAGWWVMPLPSDLAPREHQSLLERIAPALVVDDQHDAPEQASSASPVIGEGGLMLSTSGTTQQPRIVCRSTRSLDAVAANMVEAVGFTSHTRVAAAVPLTHSYGIEHGLLAPVYAGSPVTLLPGLDAVAIATALEQGVDLLPAVPAMVERLVQMPNVTPPACIYSAGAPLPNEVERAYHQRFGKRVGQLYGMTEIGSVSFQHPDDPAYDAACVGLPMRGVQFHVDSETNELSVAAPSMLDRYLDDTAPIVDGRFVTGDLARVDERGRLFITGRSRLLIESAGRKINPMEIEAVLQMHPKVAACVVVPLRQTDAVQRLRAIVEPRLPEDRPTEDELRSFAQSHLARHKVPRRFDCLDHLPRSRTGKILRAELEHT